MRFDMSAFHGWQHGALWEDTSLAINHLSDIESSSRVTVFGN
jgi:hypothetical protein